MPFAEDTDADDMSCYFQFFFRVALLRRYRFRLVLQRTERGKAAGSRGGGQTGQVACVTEEAIPGSPAAERLTVRNGVAV